MEKYGMSFKEMNKRQKVKHIWTYYRYHILATVIAVALVGSIGKHMLFPQLDNEVDVIICGPLYMNNKEQAVVDEFKEKYHTGLGLTPMNFDGNDGTSNVMLQKIPLLLTVKNLEIVALPREQFEQFATAYGENMFTPLENVPELSKVLEAHKGKEFTWAKSVDEKGNVVDADEHIYGIEVSSFPTLSCIESNTEMIVGLTASLRDEHKAIDMYEYLLGDQNALEHFFDTDDQVASGN